MKKAITLLMLALSLTTFSQNTTKVVILDTYNKGGELRQSTLVELKTNLAQIISEIYGFEGVIDKKVDSWLLAEGFAEHPRISEEQAKKIANLSGTPYAVMSEASVDNFGYISLKTILINLDAYQVVASESTRMNNAADQIHKGCEKVVKKIIEYLPKPEMPIAEEDKEPPTVASMGNESANKELEYTEPLKPQQLTSLEAEKVSRLINRADVCIEMSYIDEAIKQYDEIVKIAPGWANVYMYLGNTYASKGDAASLQKAKENYNKFLQLTDDKDLFFEAQDKIARIEMMVELKGKEDENAENLVGAWRSALYNKYTGQPWFIVEISKTAIPNKYQIILSPKSMMYSNIVNTKAYSNVVDGKINWSYTFQETYIPNQSKYNIAGATINYLFNNNSLGALVGNVLVEDARANDVGYTNIMDFDFIADATVRKGDDYYLDLCDMYMEGSCQMRGEHHQAGRNNVEMDTVRECNFLKGDELFPVFEKVEKRGNSYYYGDIKLTNNTNKNTIINYSPYISKEEYDLELKKLNRRSAAYGITCGLALGCVLDGFIINKVLESSGDPKFFGTNFFVVSGVASGVLLTMCITTTTRWNSYLQRCYTIHNRQVDENIRKYRRRDQANVSVDVGLTPTGAGVSLNF